jgi:hypothetical protein
MRSSHFCLASEERRQGFCSRDNVPGNLAVLLVDLPCTVARWGRVYVVPALAEGEDAGPTFEMSLPFSAVEGHVPGSYASIACFRPSAIKDLRHWWAYV